MATDATDRHNVIRVRRYRGEGVWDLGSLREYEVRGHRILAVIMMVDPDGIDHLRAMPQIVAYRSVASAQSHGWELEL